VPKPETEHCFYCGERWLIGTPDYIARDSSGQEVIHEVKETRKSSKHGPPIWWIEQLATYLAFEKARGNMADTNYGRFVVRWLMGDYGRKGKGLRPLPTRASLESIRVTFPDDYHTAWLDELSRRKDQVVGKDEPPLDWQDSPRYGWECASCPVGKAIDCPQWIWGDDDRVRDNTVEVRDDVE